MSNLDEINTKVATISNGSIIVMADTHFGLRRKILNTIDCEPIHIQQLMDWLSDLKANGKWSTKLGRWGSSEKSSKILVFPEKLILLGDIFELWDASDRAIELCSKSILESILRLDCEKFHVIGNHDFAMIEHSGVYPYGLSELNIVRDTYPKQSNSQNGVSTIKVGNDYYLFLHGHQFDKTFRSGGKLWTVMSFIRDGAEAFGWFSWILILLLIPFWIKDLINWTIYVSAIHLVGDGLRIRIIEVFATIWYALKGIALHTSPITTILGVLAFPRIFTSIARPLWNKRKKTRYNRKKALDGFLKWWRSWAKNKNYTKGLKIVHGHTHLADIIDHRRYEEITGRKLSIKNESDNEELEVINIPAWVKDHAEKYRNVLRGAFLYIDSEGYEFIGWDWQAKRPFYIPKEVIKIISEEKLPKEFVKDLEEIDWPKGLLDKWIKEEESI